MWECIMQSSGSSSSSCWSAPSISFSNSDGTHASSSGSNSSTTCGSPFSFPSSVGAQTFSSTMCGSNSSTMFSSPFSFPSSVGAQTFSSTMCGSNSSTMFSSPFSFPSSVGAQTFSSTMCGSNSSTMFSSPFSFPSSVGAQTFGSSNSDMCISMTCPSFSIYNSSGTQASGSSSSSMSAPSFSFLTSVDTQASCAGTNSSSSTMSASPFPFPNSVGAQAFGSSSSSTESLFGSVGSRPSAKTNDYTSTGNTRPSFTFTSTKSTGTSDYTSTGNTNQQTPLREKIEESICLKVAIEKKTNRVVFLECSNDFVDIILSFLTLPIGRILSILQGKSPAAVIGCMTNLYQSVEYLDLKNFNTNACKEMLLRPGTFLGSTWTKLKLKVDETLDADDYQSKTSSEQADNEQDVFVKGESQLFMITDGLQVLVGSTSLSITLLKRLGITYPNELEIQDVVVNHDKLVQLLEFLFVSRSPLTHWILSEKDVPVLTKDDDDLKLTEIFDKCPERNGTKIMRLVLYIRKSQNSVLYAECGADFVDCIFSFLAFPLGSILKILDCKSQIGGLDSLYESVSSLGSNGHLKSEEARNLLLFPKLSPFYGSDNQLLHIEEISLENNLEASKNLKNVSLDNPKSSTGDRKKSGTYLKGHAKFMVTDDLTITLFSPTGGLTYLAKSNIPIADVDEVSLEFGIKEAKVLLTAALTSKTALTDVFRLKHQTDEGESLLHLEGPSLLSSSRNQTRILKDSSAVTFSDLHTESGLKALDDFLCGKSYIFCNKLTKDDVKVYSTVLEEPKSDMYPNASRWYISVSSQLASSFPGKSVGVTIVSGDAKEAAVDDSDDDLDLFGDD